MAKWIFLVISALLLFKGILGQGRNPPPTTSGAGAPPDSPGPSAKAEKTRDVFSESDLLSTSLGGDRISQLRPSYGGVLPSLSTFLPNMNNLLTSIPFLDIRRFNPELLSPLLLMAAPFLYDMIPHVSSFTSSLMPHLFVLFYPFLVHHLPRMLKGYIGRLPPLPTAPLLPSPVGGFPQRILRAIAKTVHHHPILVLLLIYKLIYPILKSIL